MTALSIEFVKHRDDLVYTRVAGLEDGRRLRTVVRRNAYNNQSTAKVELWTPAGWTFVHSIDGCDPIMTTLPNYVTRDMDKAERLLAEVADLLETIARKIIS